MIAQIRLIGAVVLLAGCGASCSRSTGAQPVTHTVTMDGVAFQPAQVTARVGDMIVWVNNDPFPHTVTSPAGDLTSPDVISNGRWSWIATKPGELAYTCRYHPTMPGSVHVE